LDDKKTKTEKQSTTSGDLQHVSLDGRHAKSKRENRDFGTVFTTGRIIARCEMPLEVALMKFNCVATGSGPINSAIASNLT
jgi:hypothetical protein